MKPPPFSLGLAALTLCTGIAAAQAPTVGDIGVAMRPTEVDQILRKRGLVAHSPREAQVVYTLHSGQKVTLPDSEHIESMRFYSPSAAAYEGEGISAQFTQTPGKEVVAIVERLLQFGMGATHPTPEAVITTLEKTYGKPTHFYKDAPARYTIKWMWNSAGELQPLRKHLAADCTGNRGVQSAQDDSRGECGARALTVRLAPGTGPNGPGIASLTARLVDYDAIRANEKYMQQRIEADIRRASRQQAAADAQPAFKP